MSSETDFFDAVIIGSGFGGSVMAYRLAEAGLRVCLLERGKAYPPNSFRANLTTWARTSGIRVLACSGSLTSGRSRNRERSCRVVWEAGR